MLESKHWGIGEPIIVVLAQVCAGFCILKGDLMHLFRKLRHTGILLAAGAILTGCTISIGGETTDAAPESVVPESSTESTDENTDVAATGEGTEAEPVIPPLGEFDSESPEFDQFNPCTEIPESLLFRTGVFGKMENQPYTEDEAICGFDVDPKYGNAMLSLAGNDWSFEEYEYLSGERSWSEYREAIPILIHRDEWFGGIGCSAIVETERGTFDVMFQSDRDENTYDSCIEAERWLKKILDMDGKNGNQSKQS